MKTAVIRLTLVYVLMTTNNVIAKPDLKTPENLSAAERTKLFQLQDTVDKKPGFSEIKLLVDFLLKHENKNQAKLYLTLAEHYVRSDDELAWLDFYRGRLALLQQNFCLVQDYLNRLQSRDMSMLFDQLLDALFEKSKNNESSYYDCALNQSYNLMKSRGLKRSNSIYLDIKFETDSAQLLPAGLRQMAMLKLALQHIDMSGLDLHVVGHADHRGSASYNLALSERRATRIQKYLIENTALNKQQIVSKGMGESQPLSDSTTTEGLAVNRRVELYFAVNAVLGD